MDKLEPIRRVFCNAGLYHHAYDDLLCQELAAVAAPQPQARPHVNLSGLVAQAFATECWRAQPHASDYEIADAILEKLAPYLAAPQPQPVGEWAMVERAAIVGICRILERDGDEHGAAAELRQLLRAAPQPQAEPVSPCPHIERCDCLSGCKYGLPGRFAQAQGCALKAAQQPQATPASSPAWTEDRLRAEATKRGWTMMQWHEPAPDGQWRYPFVVSIPSQELCALLASAPQPQALPAGEWEAFSKDTIVRFPSEADARSYADRAGMSVRAAPQPQAEPVSPCPHIERCDCLSGCKYGLPGRFAQAQGCALKAAQQPQASAEDVARIDDFIKIRLRCSIYGLNPGSVGWANEAWQRIRASLGVVK